MEGKVLSEAFPTLKIEQEHSLTANLLKVQRAVINKQSGICEVLCESEGVIEKSELDEICQDLQSQIFDSFNVRVRLNLISSVQETKTAVNDGALSARAYEEEIEEMRRQALQALSSSEGGKSQSSEKSSPTKKYKQKYKQSDENTIMGRERECPMTQIADITEPIGDVSIQGQIFSLEDRLLRNGDKYLVSFSVYDGTDSIVCKLFLRTEQWNDLKENISSGMFVKVQGKADSDYYDKSVCISPVNCIKKAENLFKKRVDNAKERRVELHCHTKMSEHDAICDVTEVVQRAVDWGHDAVAITDHGVVHAFPEVLKYMGKKKIENLKPIYGLEGYLVDDLCDVCIRTGDKSFGEPLVIYSVYTTGATSKNQEIFELGAVKLIDGKICDSFEAFIRTSRELPLRVIEDHKVPVEKVAMARSEAEVITEFLKFSEGCILATQTAVNDADYLEQCIERSGINAAPPIVDITGIARIFLSELRGYKLDQITKNLKLPMEAHHRAKDEAAASSRVLLRLIEMAEEGGSKTFSELNVLSRNSVNSIKKSPRYHIILLVQNETGRSNLYRMVSASHLDYYHSVPRIPKSFIMDHREGIIVGSACEAGEFMRAIVKGKTDRELKKIAEFYDYLEVQPIGNNGFMLRDDRYNMKSKEDLRDLNRKVVEIGEMTGKPVVATSDAHFLDPEDEIYRRIIQASRGYSDVDESTPLFMRTTDEMLEEFSYLGEEKAYEIVVTNTRKIADSINKISPVRPDKCAPVIDGAEEELKDLCHYTAVSMYGDPVPPEVSVRLEKELTSIISNGYASLYIIAHRLVKNSNDHGYLVGSRGSVGSSLVAMMAGISEVNPLPPHYYCLKCKFSDFESDMVKSVGSGSGCDLPERTCPVCGGKLKKDGFSIPFETFLGFKGDKEPDIDLNFSGEYQTQAHAYTEVIFGKGHTFKAGTIGTLAEKTGVMYAKDYYEARGKNKRYCELVRIAQHLVGVRRTTGQHPGGIVVLPKGEEIHTFTPVQHPANDTETSIITTHFDYHSIEHNLLKLDILGKDDPTVVRIMQDATGVDPESIPIDDPKVMSIFEDTSALGIKPENIGGCKLGCLGIPEFGTDFVIQMLLDTKPKTLSDLVRISGLSHGTDVWLNNAQTLIKENKTTLSGAICTRDDIMLYLIERNVEPGTAFKIMESVRKGRGLSEEWEQLMKDHDVPDWYIWSCKKIQYMFPKAHAAAYVMMACRIAYYKIYYPLAYYSSYLAIRGTGFKYGSMAFGLAKLDQHFAEIEKKSRETKLTASDQDEIRDMKIVREMYARGYSFAPVDLYKAKANRFTIIDDKRIMPSLASIDGMGEKAALAIAREAKKGTFLSKEDMIKRCKVNKSVLETMESLNILDGIADTNQLSIFDIGFNLED